MDIATLVRDAHAIARSKGWWTDGTGHISLAAKLARVHCEVSEAVDCIGLDALEQYEGPGGKPEGLPIELADIVLRVADMAGALGIDLADAIAQKMAYNRTRTLRHGGKRL